MIDENPTDTDAGVEPLPQIFIGEPADTEDGLHIDVSMPLPGPVPDEAWDIKPPVGTGEDTR